MYTIDIHSHSNELSGDFQPFADLVQFILEKFKIENAQVDIAIVDDAGIQEVHKEFMDTPDITDVISFDLTDENQDEKCFEIIVNADLAQRQAQERKHPFEAELALYITHGLLHNLGYDDAEPEQADKMHKMEDQLLNECGFGTVYHPID